MSSTFVPRFRAGDLTRWRSAAVGLVACLALVMVLAAPASATWSIVAVDPDSGQVGVAFASCAPAGILGDPAEVLIPIRLAPGIGAAIAQGTIDPARLPALDQGLADKLAPAAVVQGALEGDDQSALRQYAVVSLLADPADETASSSAHTGHLVEPVAGQRQGEQVAVQGTLLADPAVLDASLAAFTETRGAGSDLATALLAGLEAGSGEGGDRRCGDQTALFAQVVVARAFDTASEPEVLVTATVSSGDGQNPVELLGLAMADGESGWLDYSTPTGGLDRRLVLVVGVLMGLLAVVVLRYGMGSPGRRKATKM